MALYAGGATDKGPKRSYNEDGFVLVHTHGAFAVADGSGAPHDLIARAALDAFASLYHAAPAPSSSSPRRDELFAGASERSVQQRNRVVSAVRRANAAVHQLVTSTPIYKGCGTTFLAVDIDDDTATFAWVGEPVAYRFDKVSGHVARLTRPHTLVNEQLAAGLITEKEAKKSTFKNIITRVLGFGEHVEVDSITIARAKGDLLVLCTDGVWQALDEDGIAAALSTFVKKRTFQSGLTDAANALVHAANATTYGDNVTAVVIECS